MSAALDVRSAGPARSVLIVVLTAMAYATVGWAALSFFAVSGYASPIFPSSGIALAAAIVYGARGALGGALGSFALNLVLALSAGHPDATSLYGLPGAIAAGAALQAALGAGLVRRTVGQPLTLRAPREILQFGIWGGMVSTLLNASCSVTVLGLSGAVARPDLTFVWGTWWIGDALGVLVGAPIVLTLIGQPRDEWAPRRLSVGLPTFLGMLLLAGATAVFHRWEQQRLEETFRHSAQSAVNTVNERLADAINALQAVHGLYASHDEGPRVSLRPAVGWWLQNAPGLRAIGYSERVPRADVPDFEARARAQDLPSYRVFDRADPAALAASDPYVVAIRAIEPIEDNAAALGVNAMSVAAARGAMLSAAASGGNASTGGFRLTQSRRAGETGVVVYRALYRGQPATESDRLAQWRGVVFVTLELDRAVRAAMQRIGGPLSWCLVDPAAPTGARPLAGDPGCEVRRRADFSLTHAMPFAGRQWELRLHADTRDLPGGQHTGSWLFAIAGLLATSLLNMLLLTVTGRARRIELAVEDRTRELSAEVRERRHAENALRDGEQRLRSILDHIPIGVLFLDTRGRVLDTNPSLCRMLGRSAHDMAQLTAADLIDPADHKANFAATQQLLTGQVEVVDRQMRLLRGDGSPLTVRATLSALRDAEGRTLRLVGVVEDITEHLRLAEAERARDAAEASSRAKSEFVSRMSHELRTPLNAMLGFAQLLTMDRKPALASHQAVWAQQIQRAGWHLLDMINDTLDLSRIEAGLVPLNEQALDLGLMVEACVSLLADAAERRGIQIEVDLQPEAQAVMADETRLKQVLTNLVSNAIKYNRDAGLVRIESRLADGGIVEVRVNDTGLGMSPSQRAALFQPYNRLGRENTAIEGTGIGLVISRRLAELMGGSLEADSIEGEGSVFKLRLPRARFSETGSLIAGQDELSEPRYRRRLVHYIEDNETNIEVMRGILAQRSQITLEVSTSGLDGLAAVRQRRPDLILLDMHLPDIDGLELLRHLKHDAAAADIPVLVISADATAMRIEEALTLGALHYLTKPVDVHGFVHLVDEVLAGLNTRWG